MEWCESEEEKQNKIKTNDDMNNSHKRNERYTSLFHDNIIEWRSDDFPYDEASFKSKESFSHMTYAIRFRNSGSRYKPFNIIFMRMFQELINYEPEYHQVHIEECVYQKKLEKKE